MQWGPGELMRQAFHRQMQAHIPRQLSFLALPCSLQSRCSPESLQQPEPAPAAAPAPAGAAGAAAAPAAGAVGEPAPPGAPGEPAPAGIQPEPPCSSCLHPVIDGSGPRIQRLPLQNVLAVSCVHCILDALNRSCPVTNRTCIAMLQIWRLTQCLSTLLRSPHP